MTFFMLTGAPSNSMRMGGDCFGTKERMSGLGLVCDKCTTSKRYWYWGRAQVGNYSVIASYITAADKYNNSVIPIFMLARDGKILADDFTKVKFSTSNIYTNEYTKKPVANTLVYDYIDGVTHYRVTFNRSKDLVRQRFADRVKGLKAILVKLVGFDGAYMRFTGEVTIERFEGDKKIETVKEKSAVWELMYFGHAPHK